MLDNNESVRKAYTSFLLCGDVLNQLYEWMLREQGQEQKIINEAILRFAEYEFKADMYSRLEQAGDLRDSKIMLEKVFVDLETSTTGVQAEGDSRFISNMIMHGNRPQVITAEGRKINNRFVLLGGAGQGKSTISQFLAQIYRAHLLKFDNTCEASDQIQSFIKCYEKDYAYEIKCLRIPIRIILKDYAAWIAKNPDSSRGVMDYIIHKINIRVSANCETEGLREFMKTRSWVFIFDGLDEVPMSSNRAVILENISAFVDIELRRLGIDALIITTTRPQGYNEEFSEKNYNHLNIAEMSDPTCIKYLGRLTKQMEESPDERKKIMSILDEALKDPVVSRLMRRPLHASIIAILVRSGGKPPRDKYALFKEYTEIVIKRERQKNIKHISNAFNEYESEIIKIHEEAAYILQAESSKPGNPAAVFKVSEFMSLIKRKVHEENPDNADIDEAANDIYTHAVLRLSFLSEARETELEFPIRSVQEYFTANFLIKHRPEDEIIRIVKGIAPSGYWRNVFIFAVSYFMKERAHLESHIDSMCGEFNGSTLDPDDYDINKIAQTGAWIALDLLHENIFVNKPKIENKYIKHVANALKLSLTSPLTGKIAELPENILHKLINSYMKPIMIECPNSEPLWEVLWHLVDINNATAIELAEHILKQPSIDLNIIIWRYGYRQNDLTTEWFVPFVSEWLSKKGNCLATLNSRLLKAVARNDKQSNRMLTANIIKSLFISVPYDDNLSIYFSYYGVNCGAVFPSILIRELAPSIKALRLGIPITELPKPYIALLEAINTACSELEIKFFEKWSAFLLSSSVEALYDLIKAYYLEDVSIRSKLGPYFRPFLALSIVYSEFITKDIGEDDINNFLVSKYETILSTLKKVCSGVAEGLINTQEFKSSSIFYHIDYYSTIFPGKLLQAFISDFGIRPEDISNCSDAFVSTLLRISCLTFESISLETISENEDYRKIICSLFYYYQVKEVTTASDREKLSCMIIYYLALLPSTTIPDSNYNVFQDELAIHSVWHKLTTDVFSNVLVKIVKRVLYDEKEHEALKIVPYIMIRGANMEVTEADIRIIKAIGCENAYNELGRLMICLLDESKDATIDFTDLVKKLDIVLISDCVASAVNKNSISTDAAVSSICNLYKEIKSRYTQLNSDNADGVVYKLEKAMFEISTNSVCIPIEGIKP